MAETSLHSRSLESSYREVHSDRGETRRPVSLLDQLIEAGVGIDTASEYRAPSQVEEFLAASSDWDAVIQLLGRATASQLKLSEYRYTLSGLISQIEVLIETQVNVILHHADLQKLEASWRGLSYFLTQVDRSQREASRQSQVKVRLLNVSQDELRKSFSRAVEFDQSELFQKVYQQGFGQAGGEPFGLLLGDYDFQATSRDCELLRQISGVAATSFAPFIGAANSRLLGLESFSQLNRPFELSRSFSGPDYIKWKSYCRSPDAKFVGLIAPRVVYRTPYRDDGKTLFGFRFEEDVTGRILPDGSDAQVDRYLWGNPCYAFGAVAVRSFCRTGWFADVRGQRLDEVGGGMVDSLPQISFDTESEGLAIRPPTEIVLSRHWEEEFAKHGLIPLVDCQDSPYAMFPSNSSTFQSEKTSSDPNVVENERLSSMIQYVLCASRFAHYLKVIARNKLGSTDSPMELQDLLNGRWLQHYVSQSPQLAASERAKYPLRDGRVEVVSIPDQPGAYELKLYLSPRFQLDDVDVGISLETALSPNK